jgi:hypothetical protein
VKGGAVLREWNVLVEAVAPNHDNRLGADDPRLERVAQALAEWHGAISTTERGWLARIVVEAPDIVGAVGAAQRVVEEAAATAVLPDWPALRVEAVELSIFDEEFVE